MEAHLAAYIHAMHPKTPAAHRRLASSWRPVSGGPLVLRLLEGVIISDKGPDVVQHIMLIDWV